MFIECINYFQAGYLLSCKRIRANFKKYYNDA